MVARDDPSTSSSLLRQLRQPDNQLAWHRFVSSYRPLILEWVRRLLPEAEAEDVTQVVLGELVRCLPTFEYDPGRGSFRGYLRTLVKTKVVDHWRRSAAHPQPALTRDGEFDDWPDPASLDALADDLDARLRHDLARAELIVDQIRRRVSSETWQAFWLVQVMGRAPREVARLQGCSVEAVYRRLGRVRAMLRREGQP